MERQRTFILPKKKPENIDLNLSIVGNDVEVDCYNTSDGKPVHVFTEDEIRIHIPEYGWPQQKIQVEQLSEKVNQPESQKAGLLKHKSNNLGEYPTIPGKPLNLRKK